uniref:Uncharacterized protein n=1 Tax=Oryza glumipatula TaxID=40148 RepID=A0A0D9YG97_9ORYZ
MRSASEVTSPGCPSPPVYRSAISLPRHILGPPWNTGYLNELSGRNTPASSSHRSGLNSSQSVPQMSSTLAMAYAHSSKLNVASVLPLDARTARISRTTLSSTSGRPETIQKNQVSADDVVSRPARTKLVATSRRLSSLCSPLAANRDRKSSPRASPASPLSLRSRTISSAKPWIVASASRIRLSGSMLKSFLTRHSDLAGELNRAKMAFCASLNARMNSALWGAAILSLVRHAGSSPKATRQMLSNANRSSTSCKSRVRPSSPAFSSNGSSLLTISNRTVSTTKFLSERLLNS